MRAVNEVGGNGSVCCSVLYAAYYNVSTPRDVTVLISSLNTSPAWLDMVRQLNRDVFCDSTAWTDFTMTTDTAYPPPASNAENSEADSCESGVEYGVNHRRDRIAAERSTRPERVSRDDFERFDDDEFERGDRRGSSSGLTGGTNATNRVAFDCRGDDTDGDGVVIPQQAKRVLFRYFYDEFCYRLATGYGVPTLSVFRDRLKRGLYRDEGDRDHRWFVDAMLSDTRFVAAVEMRCPSAMQTNRRQTEAEASREETGTRGQREDVDDVSRDTISERARVMRTEERESVRTPISTDVADLVSRRPADDSDYMFDDEEVYTDAPPSPAAVFRKPQVAKAITDSDIDIMFDRYESELRDRRERSKARTVENNPRPSASTPAKGPSQPHYSTLHDTSNVINDSNDAAPRNGEAIGVEHKTYGDKQSPAVVVTGDNFKRPSDVVTTSRRNGKGGSRKRTHAFYDSNGMNRENKENYDTSDDGTDRSEVVSRRPDTSSSEDETWWKVRTSGDDRKRRRRGSLSIERFDVVSVGFVEPATGPPNADDLIPNTVLLLYRTERRENGVTRFVRLSRVAATTSVPTIDLTDVTWDTDELLGHLRTMFGHDVKWLGRRDCDAGRFQLRNAVLSPSSPHGLEPTVSVLLRRSASQTQQSVRLRSA